MKVEKAKSGQKCTGFFFMANSMKSQAQCTKQGWVLCKLNLLTSCHICHFFIPNFPQKMLCSIPSIFFLFLATLCIVVAILWDVYIFRNKSWWANKKKPTWSGLKFDTSSFLERKKCTQQRRELHLDWT